MRITIDNDTYIRAVAALQRSSETEDHEAAQKMREASQRYNESITDKKRKATAKATNVKSERAKNKVIKTIIEMKENNEKLTVAAVAKKAGVAYNTARKYKHHFSVL